MFILIPSFPNLYLVTARASGSSCDWLWCMLYIYRVGQKVSLLILAILQGSAVTQTVVGGLTIHLLVANFL